jgi:hypothetical protein
VVNIPEDLIATCAFVPCGRRSYAKGWCNTHYNMDRLGQELRTIVPHRDTTERDDLGNKLCIRCDGWLPEGEFAPASHTRDRLTVWCSLCIQTKKFSVTRTDFEQMLAAQGGGCAICSGASADGKNFHVDHDHACCEGQQSCGRCVRGLLCDRCNRGLGAFRDDLLLLSRAAVYLSTWRAA